MKYCLLCFILSVTLLQTTAQSRLVFPAKKYPTQSFRNPLSTPFSLVGNFGECRPNHFHSGLDVRTNGQENKQVYALADGYISRVKIEAGGFGNAIYINHANGYTTLYAHLNKFFPELENFIRKKQYAAKDWNIDITFFPDQFWVRQGTFIAWSGTTGSSQGPHLHLEIRNAITDAPLNPLLFFREIHDLKKPLISQLAIYDGNKSIYEQTPVLKKFVKGKLPQTTLEVNTDKVFLGIVADDFLQIATGTLGIYEMHLYVNNEDRFAWQMDNINYDITRYMNAHADYKTRKNKGPWIQLCTKLPNDKLTIYKSRTTENGMIDLSTGNPVNIRIEVLDVEGNRDTVSFNLLGKTAGTVSTCSNEFKAGRINNFKNEYISLNLASDALYDNICFTTSVKPSANPNSYRYQVHKSVVPVHSYFDLLLNPKTPIPDAMKNKLAMVQYSGASVVEGTPAKLLNKWVSARVRDFGDYEIVIDETAPVITTTLKERTNISKSKALYFTVKEAITSVKNCTLTVDGQWLRLAQKGNTYFYELDEYFPAGTHQIKFTATDGNDNSSTKTITLIR